MAKTIALRNCKFVPELLEGSTLTQGDLLLQNGRIAQIAPCGAQFDGVEEEFDAKGMTALPGLIDAHIHLSMTHNLAAESFFVDGATRAFEDLQFAQYLLSIGITTVRDCGEDKDFSVTALRNAIDSGIVKGPRVLTCGITLAPTKPGATPNVPFGYMIPFNVDGPMEVRKGVRYNFTKSVDFIKLYGTGSMMSKGSNPALPIMDDDEVLEAVKTAKQGGLYCASHCHSAEAIEQHVRCGVATIEHASFINEASINMLAGRTDCGIVPTLACTVDIVEHTDPNTDYGKFVIAKVRGLMDNIKKCLGVAYENGNVLIGWGTDVNINAYRREPGAEFRARKEYYGWDNLDLLKQATINSAKLCRIDDEVGSIKVGKCADVLLVDGDPVADISVMYHAPAHVFHAGEQYK